MMAGGVVIEPTLQVPETRCLPLADPPKKSYISKYFLMAIILKRTANPTPLTNWIKSKIQKLLKNKAKELKLGAIAPIFELSPQQIVNVNRRAIKVAKTPAIIP